MKSPMAANLALSLAVLIGPTGCSHKTPVPEEKAGSEQPRAATQRTVSDIAHDSLRSVVTVITSDAGGQPLAQGSGFVVTSDGKIVTNYHVIAGADSAIVKFSDGGIYAVEGVVGADKDEDIVVLKLKASEREFPFLPRGDSKQLRVGDEIVVIGSPLGLEGTVSTGIISAKRTLPDSRMEIFQITAPISPGSSGGALLNPKGEVVGVPFVQAVSGQNLNFAIPITYVSPLIVDVPAKPFPILPQSVVAKKARPKLSSSQVAEPSPPIAQTLARDPSELNGTYTGVWQSSVFAASGAAVMTVSTEGKTVHAEIALTGGSVTRENLVGEVADVGGGWSVTFKTAAGNLYATGIFKNGVFEGDYDYVPAAGSWAVGTQEGLS